MNPNNNIPNHVKSIYLMAICGTGMGSLAGLLKEKGYQVSGSDDHVYPPMSTELESQNISVYSPYSATNIQEAKPDLIIVGNAISKTNPEAEYLLSTEIPYVSMPQALDHFFLSDKEVIMASGTHGKTTITSIMAHLLHELGTDPSFLVGGVTKNFARNFKIGSGKYFVIEGDEYDTAFFDKTPKFIHYNAKHVILTSLEFDHADIYRDLDHMTESFVKLLNIIPNDGSLHYCNTYPKLNEIIKKPPSSVLPPPSYFIRQYGPNSADWQVTNFKANNQGSTFDIEVDGSTVITVKSPMTGLYNALNVAASFSVLEHIGFDLNKAVQALQNFEGIKRRQEILFENNVLVVIDDFAHHPTAVKETISAIREKFPSHYLLAVYEPRSNTSRRDIFQKEYVQSFLQADETIIAKVNNPEKIKDGHILNVPKIVEELKSLDKQAYNPLTTEDIIDQILSTKKKPVAVLIMSNGGFDGIHQKLIKEIQ